MTREKTTLDAYFWPAVTALVCLAVGYIHHRWFFQLETHGDAAGAYVLAQAIADEGSLLPRDFVYGNQLVFLRSSPFIACALLVGLKGHDAFIFGSTLSVGFGGLLLYFILSAYCESRRDACLLSVLLLLPLGPWDFDHVIGSQSHLSNAVLSVGLAIFTSLHIAGRAKASLAPACLCLLAMASEAPLRGALVLAPVLLCVALVAGRRTLLSTAAALGGAMLLASVANGLMTTSRPVVDDPLVAISFQSSSAALENLARTTSELTAHLSSLDSVSGTSLSAPRLVVFTSALAVLILYSGQFISGALLLARRISRRFQGQQERQSSTSFDAGFMARAIASAGVIIGAIAVATLNPDSARHFLWAVFLTKMLVLKGILDHSSRLFPGLAARLLIICACVAGSAWLAKLVKNDWGVQRELSTARVAIDQLRRASDETGIRAVYGTDFWSVMPMNAMLPGVNAQALVIAGSRIEPRVQFSRRSWSCAEGEALYYLGNKHIDEAIAEKLTLAGGSRIAGGTSHGIWRAPRLWQSADLCDSPWRSHDSPIEGEIDFRRPNWPAFVTSVRGVSTLESWGRWSDARQRHAVKLITRRPLPRRFSLVMEISGFGPNAGRQMEVRVGARSFSVTIPGKASEVSIDVDTQGESVTAIEFHPPSPASPRELGLSDDDRKLGVGFARLSIRPLGP